jgi:hypothetical protein
MSPMMLFPNCDLFPRSFPRRRAANGRGGATIAYRPDRKLAGDKDRVHRPVPAVRSG